MEYPHNLTVSERRWFDLIQQCRTSGKSDAQWMQEHEIKSPTFYYHVKQLRKKACDISKNSFSRQRNDVQEIVPLFMDEAPSVKSLIACIDNSTATGKHDLIIVLLAAELGLRSGDICRLKLSNIHWEHNTIEFIQFKTGVFNQLPLLENIKFALIDYLRVARPACNSELLFIGIKNNYQMISPSQMHSVVSKYFKVSGLDISKRKHGPHALRHSLASNLPDFSFRSATK